MSGKPSFALEYREGLSGPWLRVEAVFLRSPFRVHVPSRQLRFDSREQAERAIEFVRLERSASARQQAPRSYQVVEVAG